LASVTSQHDSDAPNYTDEQIEAFILTPSGERLASDRLSSVVLTAEAMGIAARDSEAPGPEALGPEALGSEAPGSGAVRAESLAEELVTAQRQLFHFSGLG
jgi:hypothetical protein